MIVFALGFYPSSLHTVDPLLVLLPQEDDVYFIAVRNADGSHTYEAGNCPVVQSLRALSPLGMERGTSCAQLTKTAIWFVREVYRREQHHD